ncbi:hypothetical protein K1W69_15285 [Hoeflea sp. WL0058]|uniref:Uncharacterized protein n=1 Tax=Flavimaribacter sediminis TaxID=2865987 RepID=A0AAE3D173_9HYPH|nr:hypothetical protein [Flavimaribacter sediminis]MBW8638559.1 hypothetical protein [Flavimaribacter sediminis]
MSEDSNDIHSRIKALGDRIKAHREKLELHGLFARDHQITEKELHSRWSELKSEVESQTHDHETAHKKADWLHKSIMKWVDAVDLDYKA